MLTPRAWLPEIMNKYPHMAPLDTVVWSEWLRQHGAQVSRVWYDVKVGAVPSLPPHSPAYVYDMAEGISTKRIDAIAEIEGELWVCEVKPFGNAAGMGQALLYGILLQEKYHDLPVIHPAIVCAEVDVDVAAVAPELGIAIFVTDINA